MTVYTQLTNSLSNLNVVPVVALNSEVDALRVAEALMRAELNCIEITFRTEAASACIEAVKKEFPEMIVAAGTVLSKEQCMTAIDKGSDFIVSPAINVEVVQTCQQQNVAIVPGVCNPQQIEQGMSLGLNTLKFFPAEIYGGTKLLKAIAPIYPVSFMPTGGISEDTWRDYLALPNVICCGGSWIVSNDLVNDGMWSEIESRARATLSE